MKTSANGLAFIEREEGNILHVYVDQVGVQTIGVGHALKKGESFPGGITHEQSIQLLAADVSLAEAAINDAVKVPLTQNQFDSLVSFTFNLGTGALRSSTLLKLLNAGDVKGAADEFLKWVKGGGKVLPGLVSRRTRERDLFLKDVGPTTVTPPSPVPAAVIPPGDVLVSVIKKYVGCSLSNRRAELGKLVARGVDDPEAVVGISTNCATTALGVMHEAGVKHPLLSKKYISGSAIIWVRQIGTDLGALVKYTGPNGPQPKVGSLLRYNTPGTNNDHVEWMLSPMAADGTADHAGGGRPNNAITLEHGNVLSSNKRPLVEFWDPDKLGIAPGVPTVTPTQPTVPPVPTPKVTPPSQPKVTPEPIQVTPPVTPPEPVVVVKEQPAPAPIVPAPAVPAMPSGVLGFIAWLFQAIVSIFTKGKQ